MPCGNCRGIHPVARWSALPRTRGRRRWERLGIRCQRRRSTAPCARTPSTAVSVRQYPLIVNPDGVRNQVEGSIIMGIGTALWEAVEFDGGRVLNPAFSRYRVPRITDAPRIEVFLVGDPTTPSTGAGEPAIVPIAAAVANAVRQATGISIEALPIVPRLA